MKKISYISVFGIGIILLFVASCTDLTETVYNQITEENFKPGPDDLARIIAPVYSAARGKFGNRNYFWSQEETADAMVSCVRPNGWYDGGEYYRMHTHSWRTTQSQNNSPYSTSFNGINSANRVIYQIESGLIPIVDEGEKIAIISELRAARAFYYSLLLDTHGNVPIVTDFTDTSLPQQNTREEVYNFVVSELLECIPNLNSNNNPSTYGRMNKWAALAVLTEVYLNAEVYTGTPQWNNVIVVTDEIISSGLFQLTDDYSDNFHHGNPSSPEIIFAIPFDSRRGTGFQVKLKSLKPFLQQPYRTATGFWGGASSAPQFILSYDEDDWRLQASWLIGDNDPVWLKGRFVDGAGEVIYDFWYNVPDVLGETNLGVSFEYGYPIGKYEIYEGMVGHSDVDFPWFRYAYILMAKAEALLRTDRADEAAVLVTKVRERAFYDNPEKATVTGADLLGGSSFNYGWWDGVNERVVESRGSDVVVEDGGADIMYGGMLDNWGWEFAAEAKRRTQLIRFGVFHTKTWLNHEPSDINKIIYPLPQNVVDNNPNLVQNPGY